jgi:hypothetical protein
VHSHGAKPQNCLVQNFCTKGGQTLQSLPGSRKEFYFFHFKHYNLIVHAVNVSETFCACSPSVLGQDLTVKIAIFFFFLFGLLEPEMVDLRCFFEKNDLRPLGINP